MSKGADCFRRAIEKDPNYATGYAGLADCASRGCWFGFLVPGDGFGKSKKLASQALTIAPNLAEAYASLGWAFTHYDFDFEAAERAFERSLELNRRYATAHEWFGSSAIYSGLTHQRLKGGLRISEWATRSGSYGKSLLAVSAVVALILLSWLAWAGALQEWLLPIQVHNVNSQYRKQDSMAPARNHSAAGDSFEEEHQAKPKQCGDAQPEPDLFDEIQSDQAAPVEHRTKAPHPQTTPPGEPQNDATRTNKSRP